MQKVVTLALCFALSALLCIHFLPPPQGLGGGVVRSGQGKAISSTSRRNIAVSLLGALTLENLNKANAEIVKFESGKDAPVLCTQAKEGMKRRRGIIDVSDTSVFERTSCKIGGYTTKIPYSIEAPDYFQPLTGYANGGPDPSGFLDMRLESEDFGGDRPVTIVVSDGKTPDRKDYPWIGKKSITELGSPDQFLKIFAPQLYVNEKMSSMKTIDGVTYYTYELYKAAANYNNRKIISAVVYDGDLITCVGLASDSNWAKAEPILKAIVSSFKIGA
ncbi:hypothetical protein AAMO2058_000166400 [Amorphochlora amoebiformis]